MLFRSAARSTNARFGFIQSIIHKNYFISLALIYQNYCSSPYRTYSYLDTRTDKTYVSLSFWTTINPIFTTLYHQFYIDKIKIVPKDLSLLTPLAFAHWVMQDGSLGTSKGLYLCTDAFTSADVQRLASYLADTYQIHVTTPKAPGKKKALRIYVLVRSMPSICTLLVPHMHSSMLYKLGI